MTKKKMFGGLIFLLDGKMCCGIVGDRLMVRVGPDAYDDALEEPFVAAMDFKSATQGMVYVDVEGLRQDDPFPGWVRWGVEFALCCKSKIAKELAPSTLPL